MSDLRSLGDTIKRAGLRADKRLGQHFLLDPTILRRIAQAASITKGDHVLEIGPGPGGLTRALLEMGAIVTTVERDARCIEILAPLAAHYPDQLKIIETDALKIDAQEIMGDHTFRIVANLPYNIGTELLTRWLLQSQGIHSIHVLLQKEVVDRLIAQTRTKAYGRLSILAQTLCQVERRFDLPPAAFHPPPKIDSSLASLWPKTDAPTGELLKALQRLTHQAFQQRRKMLRSSLKSMPIEVEALLQDSGVIPEQRPETLSPQTFLKIAKKLVAN